MSAKQGLVVQNVQEGSPAADAGFERGDVIVEVDKKPIKSVAEFRESVANRAKGKPMLFRVQRQDASLFLTVTVLAEGISGPAGAATRRRVSRDALPQARNPGSRDQERLPAGAPRPALAPSPRSPAAVLAASTLAVSREDCPLDLGPMGGRVSDDYVSVLSRRRRSTVINTEDPMERAERGSRGNGRSAPGPAPRIRRKDLQDPDRDVPEPDRPAPDGELERGGRCGRPVQLSEDESQIDNLAGVPEVK